MRKKEQYYIVMIDHDDKAEIVSYDFFYSNDVKVAIDRVRTLHPNINYKVVKVIENEKELS